MMPSSGGTSQPAAYLLPIGLGAGNIGDELVNRAFWQHLPEDSSLAVPLFCQGPRQRKAYPARHRYLPVTAMPHGPALLVGGTISDAEGVHFPLEFLAPQLIRCHERGWWVEAHGVGVDPIRTSEGRDVFQRAFLPIRKWSVRSPSCRDALLALGVVDACVHVAADWAWLYRPEGDCRAWAKAAWRSWGRDERMPLVVMNLVEPWEGLAQVITSMSSDYQVAFFSNDSRADAPDQRVVETLRWQGLRVPADSYSPEEAIALLAEAAVVVAQRYHTAVEAVLGGSRVVLLARPGRKIHSLGAELGARVIGRAEDIPAMVAMALPPKASSLMRRAARLVKELPGLHSLKVRPGRALVVHMGGLGDLVLASGLLAALKQQFTHVTLLCRQPVAGVVGLMPDGPHEVAPVAFNPYQEIAPSAALDDELNRLGELETPDVLISAEFKPTWLSWYLASRLAVANSFQAQPAPAPHGLLTVLLRRRGLVHRDLASPPPAEYAHERERYAALAEWMGAPADRAVWNKPAPADGLAPGSYIVCFPGGAPHIPEKNWGPERFREVLEGLNERCVVVGDEGDLDHLRTAAPAGADIIVGAPDRIGHIAAVVAHARAWLGNDSGLAHLAQAYGVAGVVPFGGGGGWPAYGVWGRGSIGLVCELDCFGCEWACAFAEAYCLREIPVKRVSAALREAMADPDAAPRTLRLSFSPALAHPVVKGAAEKHREVRAELARRMDALIELQHGTTAALEQALQETRAAADRMRQTAEQRLELLERAQRDHQTLEAAADRMRQTAEQRLDLLERAHRENEALRAAAADSVSQLHALAGEMELMRREASNRAQALEAAAAEAASLRKEAADRLRLLESAHIEAEGLRATAEQRLDLLNEVHKEMELLRRAAAERHLETEAQEAPETERTGETIETMKDLDRTP